MPCRQLHQSRGLPRTRRPYYCDHFGRRARDTNSGINKHPGLQLLLNQSRQPVPVPDGPIAAESDTCAFDEILSYMDKLASLDTAGIVATWLRTAAFPDRLMAPVEPPMAFRIPICRT